MTHRFDGYGYSCQNAGPVTYHTRFGGVMGIHGYSSHRLQKMPDIDHCEKQLRVRMKSSAVKYFYCLFSQLTVLLGLTKLLGPQVGCSFVFLYSSNLIFIVHRF
jgi:hypothetical protein